METPDTVLSPLLCGDNEINAAMGCLLGNLRTIYELRALIGTTHLPADQSQQLMAGIDHLEHHIVSEARAILADKSSREN